MIDNTQKEQIQKAWQTVLDRIDKAMQDAGRSDTLKLIAVSKFHTSEAVQCVAEAGQGDFGENYVQEALAKQDDLQALDLNWHFIGHVQSRKAKDIIGKFSLIHTLDSEKLALTMQKYAQEKNIQQNVLIQVNIGEESQKSGVMPDELLTLAKIVLQCQNLTLQGLMCLPPVFDAGLLARPYFANLRNLNQELSQKLQIPLPYLSMGMSGDLEAAILEGATHVRVGTDIFGNRIKA